MFSHPPPRAGVGLFEVEMQPRVRLRLVVVAVSSARGWHARLLFLLI